MGNKLDEFLALLGNSVARLVYGHDAVTASEVYVVRMALKQMGIDEQAALLIEDATRAYMNQPHP